MSTCLICGGLAGHWGTRCPKSPEYAPLVIPSPLFILRSGVAAVFGLLAFALWGASAILDRLVGCAVYVMIRVMP